MPYRPAVLLICLLVSAIAQTSQASILTNCNDLAALPPVTGGQVLRARVIGKVQETHPGHPRTHPDAINCVLLLKCATGGTFVLTPTNAPYAVGDVLDAEGTVEFVDYIGQNVIRLSSARIIRHEDPDQPISANLKQLLNGGLNFYHVSARGLVIDAFPDELDSRWTWILICNDGTVFPVAVRKNASPLTSPSDLIGCEISVDGVCTPSTGGWRPFLSPFIRVLSREKIRITAFHDDKDAFDFPQLNPIAPIRAMQRRCVDGRVLATSGENRVFVQPRSGRAVEIQLHPKSKLPSVGEAIRVSGFTASDIFYIVLIQAVWKPIPDIGILQPSILDVCSRQIQTGSDSSNEIKSKYHGRLIRLRGTVAGASDRSGERLMLLLSSDGHLVQLDISSLGTDFTVPLQGTTLSVTGVCRMEFDVQRQIAGFSRIKGFTIIVRSENDIEVLSRPSWWSPLRLTVLVGVLALLLVAILLWNLALRIVAERRGRELFRENVAHISADLRTDERTRLAVDLHDSLAQMLTGVSLQIDAGEYEIASKSLKSCRDELRNCLWDLRNQTLEERDMGEAIRRTLKPHIGAAQLVVRFNVPRAKLSDSTAHSVLMIVRELATNAVRHGHAKTIRVAGGLDADVLRFSVRDDGCGFDPDRCPGMAEGHFGLQGIRERVKRCDGTIAIESVPGKGTRVTVSLKRQK